jgi:hypothetical protein
MFCHRLHPYLRNGSVDRKHRCSKIWIYLRLCLWTISTGTKFHHVPSLYPKARQKSSIFWYKHKRGKNYHYTYHNIRLSRTRLLLCVLTHLRSSRLRSLIEPSTHFVRLVEHPAALLEILRLQQVYDNSLSAWFILPNCWRLSHITNYSSLGSKKYIKICTWQPPANLFTFFHTADSALEQY